jgi:hypothetical protein
VLLVPISILDETLENTFGISAEALFALPLVYLAPEDLTLTALGFVPDPDHAVCVFEQQGTKYTNIEVHNPEWGEKDFDFRFFTPVNDYGLVIMYFQDEKRFNLAADKGETYAKFAFYVKDNTWVDENASGNMTVEEYLIAMYNDPDIEDVYAYSLSIAEQYVADTFGMSIDELCDLPAGD